MATLSNANGQTYSDGYLLSLARARVRLPDVPMVLDYQDDADVLCLRFSELVQPGAIEENFEDGVIALYEDNLVAGVEILDITSHMNTNLDHLAQLARAEELVRD